MSNRLSPDYARTYGRTASRLSESKTISIISRLRHIIDEQRPALARIGGEFAWIFTGQAIAAFGALVGVRLLTGVLVPTEYGSLALSMTLVTLMQVVLTPVAMASTRFFAPSREAGRLAAYLRAVTNSVTRASVGVAVATLVFAILVHRFFPGWTYHVVAVGILGVLMALASVLGGMQNAARQRVVVAWHQAIGTWLRFGLAVVCVKLTSPSSLAALVGYIVASVLVVASQSMMFVWKIMPEVRESAPHDPESVASSEKDMKSYGMPFASWHVFSWAQWSSDRWSLKLVASSSEVGLFAAVYQLGYYPLFLASEAFMQLVGPVLFEQGGDATDQNRLDKAHRIEKMMVISTLGLTGIAVLAAWLLHGLVFRLFAGQAYQSVSHLLPVLVLGAGLFAAGQITSLSLMTAIRTKLLIAPKIGSAFIGIAANFTGAMLGGVTGVAWANVFFASVYLVWVTATVRRSRHVAETQ